MPRPLIFKSTLFLERVTFVKKSKHCVQLQQIISTDVYGSFPNILYMCELGMCFSEPTTRGIDVLCLHTHTQVHKMTYYSVLFHGTAYIVKSIIMNNGGGLVSCYCIRQFHHSLIQFSLHHYHCTCLVSAQCWRDCTLTCQPQFLPRSGVPPCIPLKIGR